MAAIYSINMGQRKNPATGLEPSFAGLVAQRNKVVTEFANVAVDESNRNTEVEMTPKTETNRILQEEEVKWH